MSEWNARDAALQFFEDYYEILDEEKFEEWPQLFEDVSLYRIVSRENYASGLPISAIRCESRGMLSDRVTAIRKTLVYSPRIYRRFATNFRVKEVADASVMMTHNLLLTEALINSKTEVLLSGKCFDTLVRTGDGLKIKERTVVFDTDVIPNILVYPL